MINLEKAVKSATSAYCAEYSRIFDDFLLHRMCDTTLVKKHQKNANIQHSRRSGYDSTAFSRLKRLSYHLIIVPAKMFLSFYYLDHENKSVISQ